MARHDVYKNPNGVGFVLDVQNDILEIVAVRVVVPLLPAAKYSKIAQRLNPEFTIGDRQYMMLTQLIAAVPTGELGVRVTSLKSHQDEITQALDMLFQGF